MTFTHVPVLMFHSVSERAAPAFRPYAMAPELFRNHMEMIAAQGYASITMSEHAARLRAPGPEACERSVVITFDDAFVDFRTTVLPILAELRLRATLYVPTAYVGRTSTWLEPEGEADRAIMSWSDLEDVVSSGIEVGSHSRSHPHLDTVDAERLRVEVHGSKAELEDHLGVEVASFAYPFGHSSRRVRDEVAAAGYTSGVAVRDLPSGSESPFRINRWTVDGASTPEDLARLLDARTSRLSTVRSNARGVVSYGLRRAGLK